MKKITHFFPPSSSFACQSHSHSSDTLINIRLSACYNNVTYGQNISIFPPNYGALHMQQLMMDVYEPAGDTLSARPLIVYMHPGDFLPILVNGNPTGDLHDSAVVEMCKRFALRGYVVAIWIIVSMVSLNLNQNCRTAQLLQAVYRGLQDAKTCVRFFRMNESTQATIMELIRIKLLLEGKVQPDTLPRLTLRWIQFQNFNC
jgi:hypothetical protein